MVVLGKQDYGSLEYDFLFFFYLSLVKLNLAAEAVDIFFCQAAGVSTAEPAAKAHSPASN